MFLIRERDPQTRSFFSCPSVRGRPSSEDQNYRALYFRLNVSSRRFTQPYLLGHGLEALSTHRSTTCVDEVLGSSYFDSTYNPPRNYAMRLRPDNTAYFHVAL